MCAQNAACTLPAHCRAHRLHLGAAALDSAPKQHTPDVRTNRSRASGAATMVLPFASWGAQLMRGGTKHRPGAMLARLAHAMLQASGLPKPSGCHRAGDFTLQPMRPGGELSGAMGTHGFVLLFFNGASQRFFYFIFTCILIVFYLSVCLSVSSFALPASCRSLLCFPAFASSPRRSSSPCFSLLGLLFCLFVLLLLLPLVLLCVSRCSCCCVPRFLACVVPILWFSLFYFSLPHPLVVIDHLCHSHP